MPSLDVPFFGNLVLLLVLASAAYTFAMAVAAGRGRPRLLVSARFGAYATCALVAVAVLLLAYAFQTHDFRIRYVARYSDRSMDWWYLIASLWGGQDGSILWWTFLLSIYTAACTRWLRGRYPELQPYVLATLMSIFGFFAVLMLFAANPFFVSAASVPPDGEGLNPLLQNYWMTIHPPSLYSGFVGWSVPFAFVVSALVTGRLNEEWIYATRKWVLVAWLFLSFGNMLGALWSYEELGWGGYWAWDPVENAAILPWFTGTAFLHSVMIQERYGMMKVWNVMLLCTTFLLTIFGTFLTRSGLIASVHSFARSDIGIYFSWYLLFLVIGIVALVIWRLPELRSGRPYTWESFALGATFGMLVGGVIVGIGKLVQAVHPRRHKFHEGNPPRIESFVSREGAFIFNNWILLSIMLFVIIATTFPLFSEAVRGETVTVGPGYYNKWMIPLGLTLLFLTGVGPLIAWRKASGKNLLRAFIAPGIAAGVALLLHVIVGGYLGFPAYVHSDQIYDTTTGRVLAVIYGIAPVVASTLCAFVLGAIGQEFWRGTAVRRKNTHEPLPLAILNLTLKAKRRYGGYIVHVGIVLMFLGFMGAAYDHEKEGSLRPGQSMQLDRYSIRYDGVAMEVDPNKRMVFTDLTLLADGDVVDHVSPAKFIYRTHPDMPTTEVAIRTTLRDDLYMIMSSVDPQTKVGTFKFILRPLVVWIWIGGLVLLFGTFIAVSPTVKEVLGEATARSRSRAGAAKAVASAAVLLLALAAAALALGSAARARAQDDSTSSLHAANITIRDPRERQLFERLLCMCGDCQRLPLSTCGCTEADAERASLRRRLARGESMASIIAAYREEYGPKAIAIPADQGLDRALWAVPIGAIVIAMGGALGLGLRWSRRSKAGAPTAASKAAADAGASAGAAAGVPGERPTVEDAAGRAEYDRKLEEELRDLEED